MQSRKPNKWLAPVIMAGITVGFLVSAYKFIFAKTKQQHIARTQAQLERASDVQEMDG